MRIDLTNRRVLVTGASRGIGLAVAHRFAEAGADLIVLSEDNAIEDAARQIREKSGRAAQAVICDISDREAVRRTVGSLERIDVLINNAAIERFVPILDQDPKVEEDFLRTVAINMVGNFFVTREAVRLMGRGGRIIFTSSVWGRTAVASHVAYCGTKHGIIGMMRSLSRELGDSGITVNVVCPGWTETEMAMMNLRRMAELEGRDPDDLLRQQLAGQSIKKLLQPDDLAGIYVFLASDHAASITGQAINVDHGEFLA
ncbi:MAG: SDR family oxidoreductase [Rhodospirillaceae bacterium]|nr:SDR family oxidoreductase [Rhodospirillaceae bacterium]